MKFKQSLVNHMKTHEPGYKNETFVCEPCNITYKAKFNLRRHIRVFHEGIKPYVCEVCKQAFSNTNVSNNVIINILMIYINFHFIEYTLTNLTTFCLQLITILLKHY